MAHPLLQLTGVTKEYSRGDQLVRAVSEVDLEVPQGGFTAIVGPSGAGKSTLLHLVGGLDTPTRGSVLLEGRDLARLTTNELTLVRRRRLGFVFQFFNLLPNLPCWQNIAMPLLIDGAAPVEARDRATSLGVRLGIGHRLDTRASLLSGGEMQRTAIARALVGDPALVLADEPTGNLDRATGIEVLDILRRLVDDEGKTIVMVTHDAAAARRADVIVTMVDGAVASRHRPRKG
ncbi:MAG: ABC transporter ATP-binding protein [Candidatus Dormibacteria bacterium]